jgi:hypothetical protein
MHGISLVNLGRGEVIVWVYLFYSDERFVQF